MGLGRVTSSLSRNFATANAPGGITRHCPWKATARYREYPTGTAGLDVHLTIGLATVAPYLLLVVVLGVFAYVLIRDRRRNRNATPVRESVLADPIVSRFHPVQVQISRGMNTGGLKGGPFGVELLVRTHSFQVGIAPPLRGAFTYYFEASETEMEHSVVLFALVYPTECIVIHGNYGGDEMHVAVNSRNQLGEIWNALAVAGVRTLSSPP